MHTTCQKYPFINIKLHNISEKQLSAELIKKINEDYFHDKCVIL